MRKSFKSIVAGAAALCVVGVMSAVGATSASAAAAPFDPTQDANWVGTITFYDGAGNVVTSGDGNNPLSPQYMVGSVTPAGALPTARTQIVLDGPQPAVNPGLWSGVALNGITIYPLPAPAPAAVSSQNLPQGAMVAAAQTLWSASKTFTVKPGALANVFQVRLKSIGTTFYNATTVTIDPATGAWAQIDPAPKSPVALGLTALPATVFQTTGTVNLTATAACPTCTPAVPAVPGTFQFFNNGVSMGAADIFPDLHLTGGLTLGVHAFTVQFVPTDLVTYANLTTSAAQNVTVVANLPTPAVALTVDNAAPTTDVAVNFTSTTTPVDPGTVQLFDGLTALGTPVPAAATNTFPITFTTAGTHSVTSHFVPMDPAAFNPSTSAAVTVTVLAVVPADCSLTGSSCTDAQAFTVNVPAGSIVISTPYTTAVPFNIGTMALNAAGSQYTSSAAFGNAANPSQGVTITDTRAGGKGWTASLQSGNFVNSTVSPVGTINAGNLGFTGVAPQYITGNALGLAPKNVVTPFDTVAPVTALGFPAAAPALSLANPQKFASAAIGAGSVNVTGLFTIVAPSSVPAGLYNGTVTFTIA